MKHDTRGAERLALAWHIFGIVVSLWWTGASVAGAINLDPLTNAPGIYGVVFRHYYFSSVLSALVAAAGAIWHLWAAREHRAQLKGRKRG